MPTETPGETSMKRRSVILWADESGHPGLANTAGRIEQQERGETVLPWNQMVDQSTMLYEDRLRQAQDAHDRFGPLWESMRAWALPRHYHRARAAMVGAVGLLLRVLWR
jgi:hypothetical protein